MNEKVFVDVKEAGKEILKAIGNMDYSQIDNPNDDFRRGAMWGMAWAMNHIYAYAPKYAVEIKDNLTYPCDYCGECPIWLAAYDAPELQTYTDICNTCKTSKCELFGKEVPKDLIG